jgi:hypothetical protein
LRGGGIHLCDGGRGGAFVERARCGVRACGWGKDAPQLRTKLGLRVGRGCHLDGFRRDAVEAPALKLFQ